MIVHEDVHDALVDLLRGVYRQLPIGDPLAEGTLVGPLIDQAAFDSMQSALAAARVQGGLVSGGERMPNDLGGAYYVRPAIVLMPDQTDVVRQETFAPILYVLKYRDLEHAIATHNDVPQGLSSCIFSSDVRETEVFLSPRRIGLRYCQREHRPVRRGNRRRLRGREGHRRRP